MKMSPPPVRCRVANVCEGRGGSRCGVSDSYPCDLARAVEGVVELTLLLCPQGVKPIPSMGWLVGRVLLDLVFENFSQNRVN